MLSGNRRADRKCSENHDYGTANHQHLLRRRLPNGIALCRRQLDPHLLFNTPKLRANIRARKRMSAHTELQ